MQLGTENDRSLERSVISYETNADNYASRLIVPLGFYVSFFACTDVLQFEDPRPIALERIYLDIRDVNDDTTDCTRATPS